VLSNPRRALDYFRFHCPTRVVGFGGATCSLCLGSSVLQFYVYFCILSLMWSVTFFYLDSSLSCAILSQAGLLEVPVTYLGSLGYFLA
jgi:hypothetical protein